MAGTRYVHVIFLTSKQVVLSAYNTPNVMQSRFILLDTIKYCYWLQLLEKTKNLV